MTSTFSLAHLTVTGLSPPEVVRVASHTGHKTLGLRLIRVTAETPGYPFMRDRKMMTATKAAMDDTGVDVLDIEFVRISPDINAGDLEPFLSAGAELKAKYVITAGYDPDLARLADRLGAIEDLAVRYGLHAVLEFFPWTVVPSFGAALRCRSNRPAGYRRPRGHAAFPIARTARSNSSRIRRRRVRPLCMSLTRPCKRTTQWTNCSTRVARSDCPPRGRRHRYPRYSRPHA